MQNRWTVGLLDCARWTMDVLTLGRWTRYTLDVWSLDVWSLDSWSLDIGHWTCGRLDALDIGHCSLEVGSLLYVVVRCCTLLDVVGRWGVRPLGRSAVGTFGRWTLDLGPGKSGVGRWTLDDRTLDVGRTFRR